MQFDPIVVEKLADLYFELDTKEPKQTTVKPQGGSGAAKLLGMLQAERAKMKMRGPFGYKTVAQMEAVEDAYNRLGRDGKFTGAIEWALSHGKRDLDAVVTIVCSRAEKESRAQAKQPQASAMSILEEMYGE